MIRVLVAEDSAAARELIASILGSDPDIVVVARAADGVEAVRLTKELRPDIVTMDIHMPLLDGLRASQQIMAEQPTPIVIVSATTRVHDQELSFDALRAGALATIAKPLGPASPHFETEAAELIATVKAMASVKVVRHRFNEDVRRAEIKPTLKPPAAVTSELIVIAGSTGAPAALQLILSSFRADFPVPVAIVQHIAIGFSAALAQWLDSTTPLKVELAQDGQPLRPGLAVIAPDDMHLLITPQGAVRLARDAPEGGFRPSASRLFRSAAESYGAGATGVILSGMGNDGVAGLRLLHARGGYIIAQDEATSVVYGMPQEAVNAGVTHIVLPLPDIGPYLNRLVEHKSG
jgi:two-component system, chemotaxis family, protein-glutamate methylesterase/glutaminase